jgi:hypothetical protein
MDPLIIFKIIEGALIRVATRWWTRLAMCLTRPKLYWFDVTNHISLFTSKYCDNFFSFGAFSSTVLVNQFGKLCRLSIVQ